jgi:phosphoglycolate phosphatase-like HAD superfamily hydrolase
MGIEAVLLDIDGTLVDSNEYHVMAWRRAFEAAGISVEPPEIRKQIGKGADMLIPSVAPDLQPDVRETVAKRHGEIFRSEYLPRVQPFPCAYELIATLHRGGREILLASSADQAEVDHYVGLLSVKELLRATTSADDVAKSKPAGDIFASALQKTSGKTPQQAIAIGDTPYDVLAAAKCGIRTIVLRSGGFSDQELLSKQPVAIYNDIRDLLGNLSASMLSDGT